MHMLTPTLGISLHFSVPSQSLSAEQPLSFLNMSAFFSFNQICMEIKLIIYNNKSIFSYSVYLMPYFDDLEIFQN